MVLSISLNGLTSEVLFLANSPTTLLSHLKFLVPTAVNEKDHFKTSQWRRKYLRLLNLVPVRYSV